MIRQEYQEENDFPTLLDEDVRFEGKIETDDPNLIKGEVIGSKVDAEYLVVGDKGALLGDVNSKNLVVLGKCNGSFRVSDTLSLLKGGSIEGRIEVNTLIVQEGGGVNGECKMSKKV